MLTVKDLETGYSSARVLANVNLEVNSGEVLTLLGRNGVGKTTLLRTLAGHIQAWDGELMFDGQNITTLAPYEIAKLGIAYVPQGRGIFPKMTVTENLTLGTRSRASGSTDIPDSVYEYFPVLRERATQLAGTFSGGQQQQLAIGRALCGEPKLLLLDEPSEGIQPNIVQQIGDVLRDIAAKSGLAILLVEQNLDLGLAMADRCLVMDRGEIVYEGLPIDFEDSELVSRLLAI